MPKKKSLPTVDLLDLQDNLTASVCRVKALAHAMQSVWEHGVDDDIADGFGYLFMDTITLLDAANEGIQAISDTVDLSNETMLKLVNAK